MPKISVIVPVYGVEKYLKECLDSILTQTFLDLEIILIDDGSKDACPEIIDEYSKTDSRIIAIHKENDGYGAACNLGLEKATGKYISIIEPDDFIEPDMFADLYDIAEKYNSDVVKSCFYDNLQSKELTKCSKLNWDNNSIPQDKSFTIKECPLFLYYHPSIWSCIYKREFLNCHNIRFVEAPGAGWTDNLFQVQTMCLADRINYTSKAYYYWRRLNKNQSDDIKDWTIPFKRSVEIHNWLEANNINDADVLSCLSAREMAYINLVLNKEFSSSEIEKVYNEISKMSERMISTSKWLRKGLKSEINLLKEKGIESYYKYFRKTQRRGNFKFLRRHIISIHYNKNEKVIKLFGKIWRLAQ